MAITKKKNKFTIPKVYKDTIYAKGGFLKDARNNYFADAGGLNLWRGSGDNAEKILSSTDYRTVDVINNAKDFKADKLSKGVGAVAPTMMAFNQLKDNLGINASANANSQVMEMNDINRGNLTDAVNIDSSGKGFLEASIEGASTGIAGGSSVAGPIGALWGGIGGLAVGGISSLFGDTSRNNAKKNAEQQWTDNLKAKNQQFQYQDIRNSLANYSANGGQIFAYGGDIKSPNALTEFNAGQTHELNPQGGIMQGTGANGKPNLVEEGETKHEDYIFSDRLKVTPAISKQFKLPAGLNGKSFAQASKYLARESKDRPNDPISNNAMKAHMAMLTAAQEGLKQQKQQAEQPQQQGIPMEQPQENIMQEGSQQMAFGGYKPKEAPQIENRMQIIIQKVQQMIQQGVPQDEIEAQLERAGLKPDEAEQIVASVMQQMQQESQQTSNQQQQQLEQQQIQQQPQVAQEQQPMMPQQMANGGGLFNPYAFGGPTYTPPTAQQEQNGANFRYAFGGGLEDNKYSNFGAYPKYINTMFADGGQIQTDVSAGTNVLGFANGGYVDQTHNNNRLAQGYNVFGGESTKTNHLNKYNGELISGRYLPKKSVVNWLNKNTKGSNDGVDINSYDYNKKIYTEDNLDEDAYDSFDKRNGLKEGIFSGGYDYSQDNDLIQRLLNPISNVPTTTQNSKINIPAENIDYLGALGADVNKPNYIDKRGFGGKTIDPLMFSKFYSKVNSNYGDTDEYKGGYSSDDSENVSNGYNRNLDYLKNKMSGLKVNNPNYTKNNIYNDILRNGPHSFLDSPKEMTSPSLQEIADGLRQPSPNFSDANKSIIDFKNRAKYTDLPDNNKLSNNNLSNNNSNREPSAFWNNVGTALENTVGNPRYAPVWANIGVGISDMFQKPEITKYGRYTPERNTAHMDYTPVDTEWMANKMNATYAGTRDQLINNAGGNRAAAMAGLTGINQQQQNAIGEAYLKAQDINYGRRQAANQFNAGIETQNVAAQNAAHQQNLQIQMAEIDANARARAAKRMAARQAILNAASNIGDIGRENWAQKTGAQMTDYMTDLNDGTITFRNGKKYKEIKE